MAKKKAVTQSGEEKPSRRKRSSPRSVPAPDARGLAGFDFEGYNRQFMQRSGAAAANDAVAYSARVEALEAQPGQRYWKVIGIHHLLPDENRDRHNAFIETLDEAGRRVKNNDLRVGWIWEGKNDGPADPKRLDKPDDEPAADIPIERNMTVTLWIEGDGASERVAGLHTRHEDEVGPGGGRNSRFHHSYYIVFQRTRRAADESEQGSEGVSGSETGGSTGGDGDALFPGPFRFLRWPTEHKRIIQRFGVNPDYYKKHNLPGHEGVDIEAAEGESIYCVAPGRVKMVNTPAAYAVNGHPYGVHVRVLHADGYETIYAHFRELRVQVGETVAAGQILGVADHTGNVFGDPPDHLHLTLKHAGASTPGYPTGVIDPMPFLMPLLAPGESSIKPAPEFVLRRVAEKLGLNCNAPVNESGDITDRLLQPNLIKATGVCWVRLNFIVRPFGSPHNHTFVDRYRQIIDGLRSQGLQIYGLIGAEAVQEDPGNQFRYPPPPEPVDNPWIRTYVQNFRKIVDLFGKDIPVVESFNEPNDWHRTPSDPTKWEQAWVDPAWFAIMLQRVHEAVRDQDLTLVSGPLLSTEDGNDAEPYLRNVYRAGIDRFGWGQAGIPVPFDAVGFHPYVLRDPPDPHTMIPERYSDYVATVRRVIAAHDDPGKPLYLSEIGWQSPDENRQATCMEAGLTAGLDDPAVALCFWYGMQDDAAESYGLYRQGGLTPAHRKAIYGRFVALANNPRMAPVAQAQPKPSAARFIAELDNVPDNTVLQPGRSFVKVWRLLNTGATTWGDGYQFVFVEGQTLGAPHRLNVPHCRPGETIDMLVPFVTPPTSGDYRSVWSLADVRGNLFGPQVWAQITVAAPADAVLERGIPHAAALPADLPVLPELEALPGASPLLAAALGIIYQTYWLRVMAATGMPDPQQAMQAAADDALTQIQTLMAPG